MPRCCAVLASGRYVLGPEGEALEREIAAYLGAAHAVGCNSGTDALHLPLVAAGIGAGRRSGRPRVHLFRHRRRRSRTPAPRRSSPTSMRTRSISIARFPEGKFITTKTKAVIAVHLFGQCAALDEISRICKEQNLCWSRTCAQAHRRRLRGQARGKLGRLRRLLLLPDEEPRRRRRRRPDDGEERRARQAAALLRHHGSSRPTCTTAWAGTAGSTRCRRRSCA